MSCGDDLEDCELLPATIDADRTISGCVRIDRTNVVNGATLTVEPGTIVYFLEDGYLSVNRLQSGAKIIAEAGEGEEPITFTSGRTNPEAGAWQCVWVGGSSSASRFVGTEFEYGGAPCEVNGRLPEGQLVLNASIESVQDARFIQTSTHHLMFERDGRVEQGVIDSEFTESPMAAVRLGLNAITRGLGEGNTFDDGNYIAVDTKPNLETSGDWTAQAVPYRLERDPGGGDGQQASIRSFTVGETTSVRITAGAILEFEDLALDTLEAQLLVEGSEMAPVVFTSAADDPAPGDWGCILIRADEEGLPSSIDHAIIEYAGSGEGCTGARYEGGIVIDNGSSNISNTTFRELDGFASIVGGGPCPDVPAEPTDDNWCRAGNDFADELVEVACEYVHATECVLDE